MKIEVISVSDPVWSNEQCTQINCRVRTSAYSEELPFTASPNDPEAHGRKIFRRCVSGDYGEIQPYEERASQEKERGEGLPPDWAFAGPEVHEFLREANLENTRNSPRAIGLIWGSMLETMFNSFIENQLVRRCGEPKVLTYQKSGKKCGDTFEARIKGALSQGMIGHDLSCHLHAIQEIRNRCAHEWRLNFSNPKVADLKGEFDVLRKAYNPTFQLDDFESLIKLVFSLSCCEIMIQLANRSIP